MEDDDRGAAARAAATTTTTTANAETGTEEVFAEPVAGQRSACRPLEA